MLRPSRGSVCQLRFQSVKGFLAVVVAVIVTIAIGVAVIALVGPHPALSGSIGPIGTDSAAGKVTVGIPLTITWNRAGRVDVVGLEPVAVAGYPLPRVLGVSKQTSTPYGSIVGTAVSGKAAQADDFIVWLTNSTGAGTTDASATFLLAYRYAGDLFNLTAGGGSALCFGSRVACQSRVLAATSAIATLQRAISAGGQS